MTSTIARDGVTATVQPAGLVLDVREYSITLDDARAPYVEARLTCAAPDADDLDALDPRDELRVEVLLERELVAPVTGEQTRTLDLYLHERTLNAGDATVELVCRSDEAILIDDMLGGTAVDDSAEEFQDSLRDIVDAVLADFGAELEPGTADADYTVTWDATNVVRNPRLGVDGTDWMVSTALGTFARYAAGGPGGVGFAELTITTAAAGEPYVVCSAAGANLVTAGRTYSMVVYTYVTAATSLYLRYAWIDASNNVIGSIVFGDPVFAPANNWLRLKAESVVAPPGAVRISIGVSGGTPKTWPVGRKMRVTWATVVADAEAPAVFDGTGSYPADAHYTYSWAGTAHASPSTRTRLDTRAREVLKRPPGSRAWDFLSSLVDAAGLRLFCDEARRWRLVDPATFTLPGQVRVSDGWNAVAAVDRIDLSAADRGVPGYVETMVVRYTWTEAGVQRTAYDAAGEEHGIGQLVEVNRPYAGPGAAAARLARGQGRGRVLDLEALTNLTATPGQELVAIFPGAPLQIGTVSAVEWRSDGTMRIGSRGLTEYTPGAIALLTGTIDDLTGTIDDL